MPKFNYLLKFFSLRFRA